MLSLDRDDTVVYASSFSKTVCPGIRVGYLVGPAELIARIVKRATSTYISPNMVAQAIVHEFCQSGALQRSIETVRTNLKARVDALVTALERDLPDARFVAPEGGYFMWVELPEGTDVDKLFAAAGERGVTFVKGSDFLLEGGRQHAAPGLLGRHSRADRRGRRPPGRGLQEPERRPRGGVAEGLEEVGDDVVGLLFDLSFAVAAGDVAVAAQPQVAVVVGSAWWGRWCWRPSSSTATRRSRHRQSTVHGPTDWLRCGSSICGR